MLIFELCPGLGYLPNAGVASETQDGLFPNATLQNIARGLKERVLRLLHQLIRPHLTGASFGGDTFLGRRRSVMPDLFLPGYQGMKSLLYPVNDEGGV